MNSVHWKSGYSADSYFRLSLREPSVDSPQFKFVKAACQTLPIEIDVTHTEDNKLSLSILMHEMVGDILLNNYNLLKDEDVSFVLFVDEYGTKDNIERSSTRYTNVKIKDVETIEKVDKFETYIMRKVIMTGDFNNEIREVTDEFTVTEVKGEHIQVGDNHDNSSNFFSQSDLDKFNSFTPKILKNPQDNTLVEFISGVTTTNGDSAYILILDDGKGLPKTNNSKLLKHELETLFCKLKVSLEPSHDPAKLRVVLGYIEMGDSGCYNLYDYFHSIYNEPATNISILIAAFSEKELVKTYLLGGDNEIVSLMKTRTDGVDRTEVILLGEDKTSEIDEFTIGLLQAKLSMIMNISFR